MPGLWGHVKGGMGAISMAIARSAEAAGAVVRTGAAVRSIDVVDGRHGRRDARQRRGAAAPRWCMSGAHPQTTVLDMVGAEHFPDEVAEDMRRYKTRGGSVKVNWVLSELPRYEGVSATRSSSGSCAPAWRSARRSTTSSARGRTRCRGMPSEAPYLEVECPSTIDPR